MQASPLSETSVRQMVDGFYAKVREDALLSPVFERMLAGRWAHHMPRMYAFWTKVLLGQGEFHGNVFSKHMALEGLEKEHFRRWLALFGETARQTWNEDDAVAALTAAERIAASLQLGYFGD